MTAAATVLDGEAGILAAVGRALGASEQVEITDGRIADFLAATGAPDATYLAIALSNMFLPQVVEVRGFALGVNVGTDVVRFGPVLRAGDVVFADATLVDASEVKGSIQTRMTIVVRVVGKVEPACEVESLSRWMEPT